MLLISTSCNHGKYCQITYGNIKTIYIPNEILVKDLILYFSGFKSHKVPDNIDTIIVGSGIGSLTTAVLLGRAGYKVLVLEQHDQAGGCCHSYVDKGFEFDTGTYLKLFVPFKTRKFLQYSYVTICALIYI